MQSQRITITNGGMMKREKFTREEAIALFLEHNEDPFHLVHALTLEGCMRFFAKEEGLEEEQDFWAMVGLLHDIDFEEFPEEHLDHTEEILRKIEASEELIRAIRSHGYGICSDVKPQHKMEKILFAIDELTGIVDAARRLRPSKSVQDMNVKSLKKKFKSKSFAAGCSREIIQKGAEQLEWSMDELYEKTLLAMRDCEEFVQNEFDRLTQSFSNS